MAEFLLELAVVPGERNLNRTKIPNGQQWSAGPASEWSTHIFDKDFRYVVGALHPVSVVTGVDAILVHHHVAVVAAATASAARAIGPRSAVGGYGVGAGRIAVHGSVHVGARGRVVLVLATAAAAILAAVDIDAKRVEDAG